MCVCVCGWVCALKLCDIVTVECVYCSYYLNVITVMCCVYVCAWLCAVKLCDLLTVKCVYFSYCRNVITVMCVCVCLCSETV
jgi:hypothetical protein